MFKSGDNFKLFTFGFGGEGSRREAEGAMTALIEEADMELEMECCDGVFECATDEEADVSNQENVKRILDMVAEGKITSEQAAELIAALGEKKETAGPSASAVVVHPEIAGSRSNEPKKKLRIIVQCHDGRKNKDVNIAVPLGLASAAFGCIPRKVNDDLKKEGIDLGLGRPRRVVSTFKRGHRRL